MKKHKYYSQLTPKQKDKASNLYLDVRLNLLGLDSGLRRAILMGIGIERIINIKEELRGEKMFYYDKADCYVPLNFAELIKNN